MIPEQALVTGAASGLGLELCRLLAADSYALIMVDKDGEGLERAAESIADTWGIRPETIPPGPSEDLPAGGGWSEGKWRLEWSRPRASDSPYDQDLVDPEATYRFFVKLFLGLDDRPDPVSDIHELRLVP